MRLEWLEDILAVAQTRSFSEAAERRHLTQSAFSRRIQTIEDYVGVDLFDRSRKPVQLLDHTLDQRDQIARIAGLLRELVVDLRRGDRMADNRLIITSQHALTTSLTPKIIEQIRRHRSDIYFRLRSANLAECFAQLLSRQADIAIVYRLPDDNHPINGSYIESVTIGVERLIPVIAKSAEARVAADLCAGVVPYVAYPSEVFLGEVLGRSILPGLRDLGQPVPKAETALTLAAIELAGIGIATAWVPESLARERIAAGNLVDLSASLPDCVLHVMAVRLEGTPGPVEAVVWSHLMAMQTRT